MKVSSRVVGPLEWRDGLSALLCGVPGVGFRVQRLGFRGSGFRGSGFRGSGFRVLGSGFRT